MAVLDIEAGQTEVRFWASAHGCVTSGGTTMDRLTNLASILLLSASSALVTGCMAGDDETLDEGSAQTEQADTTSDAVEATQDAAPADGEAVAESSQALHACGMAFSTCYRPELVPSYTPYVSWTAIPRLTYTLHPSVGFTTQWNLIYRAYSRPVTCFVNPC
ncbi:hypothetical protein [Sorangium sp. So ce406]|uniref:hypothetical protein n=1 Tax=Sorangium sp. So ce406 TaxID=3133311 RepID=UPI003F5C288A